jgi:hypothetical protein
MLFNVNPEIVLTSPDPCGLPCPALRARRAAPASARSLKGRRMVTPVVTATGTCARGRPRSSNICGSYGVTNERDPDRKTRSDILQPNV